MIPPRLGSLAAPLCLALAPLAGQTMVGTVVDHSATDVHNRCSGTNQRVVACAPDGSMWTLLYRDDGSTRSLYLRSSTDDGKTWSGAYNTAIATPGSIGSIAIDRVSNLLHVGWTAKGSTTYNSAYYQAFDVATKTWVGTPQNVAAGYGSNNQFGVQDIAVTPKGTVVLAINGHRSGGLGMSSWSTALAVKKVTDTAFPPNTSSNSNLYQMNTSSGTGCNLQVEGENIHCIFRDTAGGYGPRYSVFDTETLTYSIKAVPIGPGNNTTPPAGAGSIYSFFMDPSGGKWVLWPSGIVSGSQIAALRLAYAGPGMGGQNADWTDTQIFNDATTSPLGNKITGGNTSERWFTIAYAGNDTVNLVYSKPSEDFRNLYWEIWSAGSQVLGPVAPVTSTVDYKFQWVSGVRNNELESAAMFMVWGERDVTATPSRSGKVTFWSNRPSNRVVDFGLACQGTLSEAPNLSVDGPAASGGTFTLQFSDHPASSSTLLAVGLQLLQPPLDLQFMGAPACYLNHDFPLVTGLAMNAQGEFNLPISVPSGTPTGTAAYLQNFVLAPGANAGGAVTSNSLYIKL